MSAPAEAPAVAVTAVDRLIEEWHRSGSRVRQIAAVLGRELLGQPPSTPVPSSMKIAGRFSTSNATAVRARDLLTDAGIIYQARNGHYYAAGPEARLKAAEHLMTTRLGVVPHHGPIRPDCPLECLLAVMPLMSFNRLKWADHPPQTVSDVLDLYARNQLGEIEGLGPRRTEHIKRALLRAGLNPAGHEQPAQTKKT